MLPVVEYQLLDANLKSTFFFPLGIIYLIFSLSISQQPPAYTHTHSGLIKDYLADLCKDPVVKRDDALLTHTYMA